MLKEGYVFLTSSRLVMVASLLVGRHKNSSPNAFRNDGSKVRFRSAKANRFCIGSE